ncbi:MAG: hypothetical protein COX07_05760 [Bacteroidetes bacterium CG23_combo_of_CG06-09_8_20_14_all_32_9]|nr:MAG: hypothetical protein COX07_05760 [Bacteroidetes bacterium CG23_combo_of_CG06-09_8_20_14_all_32_9]
MIFVTGGTGFLGAHLLARLAGEGMSVRALKRKSSSTEKLQKIFSKYGCSDFYNKIEWIEGDILEYGLLLESLQGVSHVIHAAAIVSFNKKDFNTVVKGNVKGTSNLIDAALSNNVQRLCYVSSIAALGVNENGNLIDENSKWCNVKGNSAYSIAKYYSELQVWRGYYEGLPCVVVNPAVILGAGNWRTDISSLFAKVSKGLNHYSGGSSGFVDVTDVAEIIIQLTLHSEVNGERFIISAENISYCNLLGMIAKALGKEPPTKEISEAMLKFESKLSSFGSFFSKNKSMLSSDLVRIATAKRHYSNKKICNLLSYHFKPVQETINEMAKEFLCNFL